MTAEAAAIREVMDIYAAWESRPIERRCTGLADCCRFRIAGHLPYLTKGEALLAMRTWKSTGRRAVNIPSDGSCPFLHPQSGKCLIYHGRPFGCRTHFCAAAGGPAPRNQVRDLIQRLEEIDHRLGGKGAVNLPAAIKDACRKSA
jgi:uncharacterized protein